MEKERTQKKQAENAYDSLANDIAEEIITENSSEENLSQNTELNEYCIQDYTIDENLSEEKIHRENKGREENDDSSAVRIPKNVKQIGNIDKKSRIYVEDYVVTYLKRFRNEQKLPFGAAALYGKVAYVNGVKYVFISGAAYREADDNYEDGLTEDMLLYYKECGQNYFPEYNGVGIAVIHDGNIRIPVKWHQKNNLASLIGRGEVFIDINCDEEDAEYAFVHDDGVEIKEGHYIYYDKNEAMQSFMVDWHEKGQIHELEEDRDEVVSESCRLVLNDKKESRHINFATFCTSASSVIILAAMCIVGINMMNHGQEVSSGEVRISTISQEDAFDRAEAVQVLTSESKEEQMGILLEDFIDNQTGEEQASIMNANDETHGDEEHVNSNNADNLQDEDSGEELKGKTATEISQSDAEIDTSNSTNNDALELSEENENVINQKAVEKDSLEQQIDEDSVSGADAEEDDIQETMGRAEKTSETYFDYKIKKGDTLYEICMQKYGSISKLHEICIRNDIENQDSIYYGQIIELPEE